LGENEMKPKRGPPQNVRLSDRLGRTALVLNTIGKAKFVLLHFESLCLLWHPKRPTQTAAHADTLAAKKELGPTRQTDCAAQHAGAKRQPRTDYTKPNTRQTPNGCFNLVLIIYHGRK